MSSGRLRPTHFCHLTSSVTHVQYNMTMVIGHSSYQLHCGKSDNICSTRHVSGLLHLQAGRLQTNLAPTDGGGQPYRQPTSNARNGDTAATTAPMLSRGFDSNLDSCATSLGNCPRVSIFAQIKAAPSSEEGEFVPGVDNHWVPCDMTAKSANEWSVTV